MEAKGVIKAGVRWQVGDGKSINIWSDKWLDRPYSFRIITPNPLNSDLARVSDLLNDRGEWDSDKIQAHFWPEDAQEILRIPLGKNPVPDRLVWHYNSNGLYSVRSACRMGWKPKQREEGIEVEGTSNGQGADWRFIWKQGVPNKIKVMMWRLCRSALPVNMRLNKKGVRIDKTCPICKTEEEDVRHAFLECPLSKQCWALSNLAWMKISQFHESPENWVRFVRSRVTNEEFEFFCTLCWAIWFNRNKAMMGEETKNAEDITRFARTYLSNVKDVCLKMRGQEDRIPGRWTAPQGDCVKVNFDGALFRQDGSAGLGVIARDSRGRCRAWKSLKVRHVDKPDVAEAMAGRLAMELIIGKGWDNVWLEGDSLKIIKSIESDASAPSEALNIVKDIREELRKCRRCRVGHVRREGNKVAHRLARMAIDREEGEERVPSLVEALVLAEEII